MEIMEIMDWSRRLSSGNCAIAIFLITQADTSRGLSPVQDSASG